MSAIVLSLDEVDRREDMLKYNTLILSSLAVSSNQENDLVASYHFLHNSELKFQPQWIRHIEKLQTIRMEYERPDSSFLMLEFKAGEIAYTVETVDGQTFGEKCSSIEDAVKAVNDFYFSY